MKNMNFDPTPHASEAPDFEYSKVLGKLKVMKFKSPKSVKKEIKPIPCTLPCCVPNKILNENVRLAIAEQKGKHKVAEAKAFTCEAEGYGIDCKGTKCKAHIITQMFRPLKTEKSNILIICKAHEAWFNDQPLKVWYLYVREHYPDRFKEIHKRVREIHEQLHEYIETANTIAL